MTGFAANKFGLIALVIIFLFLYGYFNTSANLYYPLEVDELEMQNISFSTESINLGSPSDFHFFVDVKYDEQDIYYRISIPTQLNQSIVTSNFVYIPETKIEQFTQSDLEDIYKHWIRTEAYCIKISLADTTMASITGDGKVRSLLETKNIQVRNDLITDIDLIGAQESISEVLIGLTKEAKFRANASSTGIIFIDILK